MTFDEWANYGWQRGWCGPPVCYIHDGLPMSDQEQDQLDEGDDPCVHVIRLYEQSDTAAQVCESHPPTVWRAKNRGW